MPRTMSSAMRGWRIEAALIRTPGYEREGIVRRIGLGYCIRAVPPATRLWPMPRPDQPRSPQTARSSGRRVGSQSPARTEGPNIGVMPLARQTVASMTLDALRDGILHGNYAEGEPLRQDALADELGVSRIPIREALRQLEAEGLVTFSPHRGAIVSSLSLSEIEEVYELRADVESDLIRRAVPNLTAEDDARAAEILDAYEAAHHAGQVGVWGALNWKFHSTLYAPADRELTMSI